MLRVVPYRMKPTYVYIIQINEFYKIGMAVNLKKRINQFYSYSPYEIIVVMLQVFPNRSDAAGFEADLHRKFADKRVRGEWFKLSEEDIQSCQTAG